MAGKIKVKFDVIENIFAKLPQNLLQHLMPFQKEGVEYAIQKNGKCLIADEMGLGKTLQAISVSYYYREEWPLLIIVPSALKYCWIEELEKWLPDLHPHEINLLSSGQDAGAIASSKVTIATFGLLSKQTSHIIKEALQNQQFQVVIVDESHFIKNRKTASCKTVLPLIQNAKRRILLSGTPALARPVELYPQLEALCPGEFGTWTSFTDRYCDARFEYFGRIKRRNVNGASNLEELQEKLQTKVMIRREKSEVLTQLPPKQRQRVLFELKDSSIKKEIRETFDELSKLLKGKLNFILKITEPSSSDEPNQVQRVSTLSLIQKLYMLSGEAKIGPVREYIEMLCENTNLKFLIFAYHRCMMNGIQQTLWDKKVKFIRIDGDTKMSERHQMVQQYQSDPDTKVAILSILAAGTGLTFTAAKLVVFAEMYWTPGVMVQCEDRAHRIGQTGCVAVHYLVAKGTMDDWVWSAVCKKTVVTSTALSGYKKNLEADEGDKYQLDILNNANMWVAPSNEDLDLSGYLQSQQPTDQKSILSFFSPSQTMSNSGRTPNSSNHKKRLREENDIGQSKKKRTLNDSKVVILIDSSEGEDAFAVHSPRRKKNAKRQKKAKVETQLVLEDSESEKIDFDFEHSFESEKKNCLVNSDVGDKEENSHNVHSDSSEDSCDCKLPKLTSTSRKRKKSSEISSNLSSSQQRFHDSDCVTPSNKKKNTASVMKFCDKTPNNKTNSSSESVTKLPEHVNTWSCSVCTFSNHQEIPYCEMCDTPKKENKKTNSHSGRNISVHSDIIEKTMNTDDIKVDTGSCESSKLERGIENHSHELGKHQILLPNHSPDLSNEISEEESDVDSSNTSAGNISLRDSSDSEHHLRPDESDLFVHNGSALESSAQSQSTNNNESCSDMVSNNGLSLGEKANVLSDSGNVEEFDDEFTVDDMQKIDELDSSQTHTHKEEEKRVVDIDSQPVYDEFLYCCSKHTGRIYLFDKNGKSLDANFLPLDVEIGNADSLPDFLLHPKNLKMVQKFVREWNSLTETKRRMIIKHSDLFLSPLRMYEELKHRQTLSTDRHRTRESLTSAAVIKADEISGTVRFVNRPDRNAKSLMNKKSDTSTRDLNVTDGVAQTVNAEGVPLCINCQKPYTNELLDKSTITNSENSWQTRFCSASCMDAHWMKTNSDYIREKVYEAERGVCQMCGIDAHCTYKQIKKNKEFLRAWEAYFKDTTDMKKRVELLNKTKFKTLKSKQKEVMVKKPVPGQFWHADHIKPVWEGGGQCDIDNIRTLCVLCHQSVTAKQAHKRAIVRRLSNAVGSGNIKAFFQPV